MGPEGRHPAFRRPEGAPHGGLRRSPARLDLPDQVLTQGEDVAGGRRGSAGAEVRRAVEEWPVRLVADRADERHRTGGGGAHHELVAEREEVLHRTAAPGHHDDVEIQAAQRPNPGGQRSRRPGPLHRCVLFADPDAGEPPAGRSREIDRRVAAGRGQEADPEREKGESALPRRIEQPLAFETRFPLLKFLQQRADPGLLEALDLELVDALALVGAQPAEGADPVPRLGNEGEAPGVAGPGHGLEDHPLLAEGQVEVAALRPAYLGEFPLDPEAPWEAVLQHLPDAGTDLPDRERGRGRPRTGGGSRLDPGFRRRRRDRRRR